MTDIHIQPDRIEKSVLEILGLVKNKQEAIDNKWLTEPQIMEILNLTKRGMKDLRKKHIIRNQLCHRA